MLLLLRLLVELPIAAGVGVHVQEADRGCVRVRRRLDWLRSETRPLEQEGDAPDVTVMLPTLDGHGRQPLATKTRSFSGNFRLYSIQTYR